MLSSSVCSYVASTFPAGEGKGDAQHTMKKIPTLRVALRVRLRYAPLRMTGYIKPFPAGIPFPPVKAFEVRLSNLKMKCVVLNL